MQYAMWSKHWEVLLSLADCTKLKGLASHLRHFTYIKNGERHPEQYANWTSCMGQLLCSLWAVFLWTAFFFLCRVLSFALVSVLTYLYTDLSTSPADSRTTMPVVPVGWERNLESHSTFQKYAWTRAEMLWTNDRGRVKEELVLIPMFDTIYVTQRGNSALLSWSRSCNENKGGTFFCFAASKTYSFAAMMLLLFLFNSIKMDQVQMQPNYGKINKQEKELVCWGRSCPDQVL